MRALIETARAFWQNRVGATSLEYAIIGAGLSICIVAGAKSIGLNVSGKFLAVANNLQ